MLHPPTPLLVTAALVLVSACGDHPPDPGADGWVGTVDTLESGRLVVRNHDVPLWGDTERWELRERYRIGALLGEGPEVFGNIGDIELGPGGELLVLDTQASEIRVFGPNGEHLRTFGRVGEGPGELNRPAGMALDSEGTLWILNWGNGRYTGFDPGTGEVVDERRRLASFVAMPWPGRFDEGGRLLDVGLGGDGDPVILRLDGGFIPRDTLPLPQPDDDHRIFFVRGEVPVMSMVVPYMPQPSWAAHPGHGIVVGEGGSYRLHHLDFGGDTLSTVEVRRESLPVSRAERDTALVRFRETAEQLAGEATPQREPSIPSTKPAHGALFVDEGGRIWVRRTAEADALPSWDVFRGDGRLLGEVASPVQLTFTTPAVRDDRMAVGVSLDGAPGVIVFDVVRGGVHPR